MSLRLAPRIFRRSLSTTTCRHHLHSNFHSSNPQRHVQMGLVAKWYLPTMALLTLTIPTLGNSLLSLLPSSHESLSQAIERGIQQQSWIKGATWTVHQRNRRNRVLEDAYGERGSLRDVERAMEVYEVQ